MQFAEDAFMNVILRGPEELSLPNSSEVENLEGVNEEEESENIELGFADDYDFDLIVE